jgi:hypothetical protein
MQVRDGQSQYHSTLAHYGFGAQQEYRAGTTCPQHGRKPANKAEQLAAEQSAAVPIAASKPRTLCPNITARSE